MADFLGMALPGIGDLISAGTDLLGGIFNRQAASQNNLMNIAQQQALMTNGLTMKAADARQAEKLYGINALTALGATPSTWSNVVGDDSLGSSIKSAGQDLGRAVNAATDKPSRADQLNEQLLEAKIANVKADTIRTTALASEIARKTAAPGNPPGVNVPLPPEDPRGPVIPLVQRARDPRTGEIVWIPSEKAASPLQTGLATAPLNTALGARAASEALLGYDHPRVMSESSNRSRIQYDGYGNPY